MGWAQCAQRAFMHIKRCSRRHGRARGEISRLEVNSRDSRDDVAAVAPFAQRRLDADEARRTTLVEVARHLLEV